MASRSIIRSVDELNHAVHIEVVDEIKIDLTGTQESVSAPCVRVIGDADGAVFKYADFRGADLSGLQGRFVIEDGMVAGCVLPRAAVLVRPCYDLQWKRPKSEKVTRRDLVTIIAAVFAGGCTIIGALLAG